ncbi:MAG: tRNA (guanosine(46)-N7)-methyltransferase TrmB [Bacteroidaceae bacterium]|nr:tRNA (guanosine(46)-N7)-methyltransferase TrmB [Bacteroidaceae bacterium]
MGKGKLQKFADMAQNPLVVECPFAALPREGEFPLRGRWRKDFFHNDAPIVLELGCGRGEYTVGLGRMVPEKNYIGVDIKGARMWTGASEALETGMQNVGFLRTQIEFIDQFFAPGEVSEIWLTFSDPQMKKASKRLTSTSFLERYRRFMQPDGLVHLKTDSRFLFTYTCELLRANGIPTLACTDNLYAGREAHDGLLSHAAAIQTYYEQMWRQQGIDIKYLCFRLPQEGTLAEPDVEIPLDEYRSYHRPKRSGKETGK